MIRRTIEITLDPEFMGVTANDLPRHIRAALGYLSYWAIDGIGTYSGKVTVLGDREGNLHANYHNLDGKFTYHLFGLRGEDGSYTFHS